MRPRPHVMPDEKLPRGGAHKEGLRAGADACGLDSVFMTDTCRFGVAFSDTTMELLQQVLTGATITVSQQTVSRTGSQQTGW